MKSIIVIPARLDSKRLPNKLIADINGKPMLKWVLESCLKSKLSNSLFLCTDSNELASIAKDCNVQTFLTSSDCQSGTDRIASILKRLCNSDPLNKTLIINVQGDQPFIDPNLIDKMIREFKNKDYLTEVITPVYKLNKDSVHNPNVVKTLLDKSHRAIYFSRSAIPHIRDVPKEKWFERYPYYGHVGIYGYRADILMRWSSLKNSTLEELERLEQLRFIDNGIKVDTFMVKGSFLSVDTEDQLTKARIIAKNMKEV